MAARVLLVDDSAHAQRIGGQILREEGCVVVTAGDGHTALSLWREQRPDVVLLDVQLPDATGYELCRQLRQQPGPPVPIVLVAGALEELDEEEGQRCGCNATMRKPFEASVLLGLLQPFLDAARSGVEPVAPNPEIVSPLPSTLARLPRSGNFQNDFSALADEITQQILVALGR